MAYVEKEKVLEIAKDKYYSDFHKSMADLTSLRELLEDTPTSDVVEVVRCKDCKWYQNLEIVDKVQTRCFNLAGLSRVCNPNDFCSYGERKDGE